MVSKNKHQQSGSQIPIVKSSSHKTIPEQIRTISEGILAMGEILEQKCQMTQTLEETLESFGQLLESAVEKLGVMENSICSIQQGNKDLKTDIQIHNKELVQSRYQQEQQRLLSENISRSVERLVQDSIERNVIDPLCIGIMEVCSPLWHLSDHSHDIGSELQSLIEKHGLRFICPEIQDPFIPQEHFPLTHRLTTADSLHGQIAGRHSIGLKRSNRVVSQARVEVYRYESKRKGANI